MMKHKDGRSLPSPYFAITNHKTGEVLLEVTTPLPPGAAPVPPVEEECCGFFKEAIAFVTEAQARSYELFGRIAARPVECQPLQGSSGLNTELRDRFMEAIVRDEATSSSVINSAEWEADGGEEGSGSEHDQFCTSAAEEEVECNSEGGAIGPPKKRTRN